MSEGSERRTSSREETAVSDEMVGRIRDHFEEAITYLTEHDRPERVRGIEWARDMFEQELRVARSAETSLRDRVQMLKGALEVKDEVDALRSRVDEILAEMAPNVKAAPSTHNHTWLWCSFHEKFGVTDPEHLWDDGNTLWCGADGSATCPGTHRRALVGEAIDSAADQPLGDEEEQP